MKIVLTSDIHCRTITTPPADVLIVSGDMTFRATKAELDWFEEWLGQQPQTHKIWIAGNHELAIESNPQLAIALAKRTGSHYLYEDVFEIDKVRFYGSPWTPWFYDWAFNYHRPTDRWHNIPVCDVLITHGPPAGILDQTMHGDHVGCSDLMNAIKNMQERPKLHVFGHIHCAYGQREELGMKFVNASICDENYAAANAPILVEL